LPPSQRDLTNLYVSESYYRLMQTDPTDDKTLLDGTGSLVTQLAVSGTVDAYYFKGDGSQLTNVSISGSNAFTSSQQILNALRDQTLQVNTLVAQQYVVSSSVIYVTQSWSSGSTIFGNTADDTHQFTGSVFIQGPLTITGGVTGSITTASYIDPLFISSSAVQYGFSTPPLYWDNIQNKPTNLISGSGQLDILGLSTTDNVVFGTVSASSANFDGNVVIDGTLTARTYVISSSVLDVTTLRESGSTIFGNTADDTHQFTGSLLLDGAATSSLGFYGNLTGTSSYAALAETSSYLDPLFISSSVAYYGFAGSNNVQWDNILFKPTNIISGSGQRDILGLAESDSPRFSTIYGTNANLDANLVVGGTITARTYVISSSVVNYETLNVSGSTKFGESTDDLHEFTGSISTDSPLLFSNETTYGPPNLSGSTDRITLWDNSTNPTAYNYAIGIEGNHLWSSVDVNDPDWGFKWYAGGVEIAHLDGTGNLGLTTVSASSFTGSLEGTSSWAINSLTASYALNAAGFESGSFATTASNTFTGDQNFATNTVIGDTTYSTVGGNPIDLYYGVSKGDVANRFGGIKVSEYDWSGGNLASKVEIFTDSEAQDFSTRRVLVDGFGNVSINANTEVTGNLLVTGTLTAQEFHTEIVSASILYESGSTKFGDTLDDTHSFTGSLQVSGALVIPTVQTLSPTADVGSIVINNNNLYIYF